MIDVRLALPVRSPSPLSVPWTCRAPARTAAIELATAQPVSSWQWMPIVTSSPTWACTRADDLLDLVRQRAAVRVAEHDVGRSLQDRRLEGPERELGVALEPVEEVLHVDEDLTAVAVQELHRVGDHRGALVERGLERLGDVVLAALGDDAHRRGARRREGAAASGRRRPCREGGGSTRRPRTSSRRVRARWRRGRRTRCPSGWHRASHPR